MIGITCDVDWAPESVIEYTLDLFESNKICCTLFATHKSQVLDNCNRNYFEIGLHPNFNFLLNNKSDKSFTEIIDDLKILYPEAMGIRSHCLTQNTIMTEAIAKRGFSYESNDLVPFGKNLPGIKLWNNLVRIPIIWEDDLHWRYNKGFENHGIDMNEQGVKIFNFHPIHIFLNTPTAAFYNGVKEHYQNPDALNKLVNKEIPGTRDLLLSLFNEIKERNLDPLKMSAIAEGILNSN